MPLVNLKPVLAEAKAQGYAVAAFNPVDYASMKAMVTAADDLVGLDRAERDRHSLYDGLEAGALVVQETP